MPLLQDPIPAPVFPDREKIVSRPGVPVLRSFR
jgi:hypothetical protein